MVKNYHNRKNAPDGSEWMAKRSKIKVMQVKKKREIKRENRIPKTNAQKQHDYREKKKLKDKEVYLENEKTRKQNAKLKNDPDALSAIEALTTMKKSQAETIVDVDALSAVEALTTMKQLQPEKIDRRSYRLKDKAPAILQEISNVRLERKVVVGKGYGVFADADINPATEICDYGGKRYIKKHLVDKKVLQANNDKVIQVRDGRGKLRDIWWDGATSKTLGPYVNHACSCESNTQIIFEGREFMPVILSTKLIRKGEELLLDYGIVYDHTCEEDRSLDWYRDYKCRICGQRTKLN